MRASGGDARRGRVKASGGARCAFPLWLSGHPSRGPSGVLQVEDRRCG